MRVAVVQGSLTDGQETVLVNASNTNVALGTGVSGAIRQACGPGYQARIVEALNQRFGGPMEPGEVLVTDAGAHPTARWVVHVAVMDYRRGFTGSSYPTLELIERACSKLWPAIEGIGERVTVAMVALGAGTGQLGVREPTRIACETLARHLQGEVAGGTPDTRIEGVTFYGYMLHERMVIADVVKGFFPDASGC